MILKKIIHAKRQEIDHLKKTRPITLLKEYIESSPPPLDFAGAVSNHDCAVIAEIKKRSPSKGRIRNDFDPVVIASLYEKCGAAAISVLTDENFFGGHRSYLLGIKKMVSLPLLRKDFIIDPYQIYETRVLGGDAVLLIAGLLEDNILKESIDLAASLDLAPLVEVHTRKELERALAAGAGIIGINNRNLNTFVTDLRVSAELVSHVPDDHIIVSESGIGTRDDVEFLMKNGIRTFLIGEALMRAHCIEEKLGVLLGKGSVQND